MDDDAAAVGSVSALETERLTRRGLRLAQFTVTYNVLEGVIAISAGLAAGLVSLVGFGLDSGIESTSAVIVALRLSVRLREGSTDEAKERLALRGAAVTFFILAAYVIVVGSRDLLTGEQPDGSPVGIGILILSLIVMPSLVWAKRRVGLALHGDRLILADAAETKVCVLLSASTLHRPTSTRDCGTGPGCTRPCRRFPPRGRSSPFACHDGLASALMNSSSEEPSRGRPPDS